MTLRTYLSGEIGRNWEKLGENWEKLARFDMSVERVCSQYDAAVAPTYSKLADFYIFGRTCYSSPSPIADDLREGKWSYNTCPNCQNARVKQTKQKKKEASDGANPYPKPSSAKRSRGDSTAPQLQQQLRTHVLPSSSLSGFPALLFSELIDGEIAFLQDNSNRKWHRVASERILAKCGGKL